MSNDTKELGVIQGSQLNYEEDGSPVLRITVQVLAGVTQLSISWSSLRELLIANRPANFNLTGIPVIVDKRSGSYVYAGPA